MSMLTFPPTPLEDYTLAALTPTEEPLVQALLQSSGDYIDLVAGLPPSPELARQLYTLLPAGKGDEDKILLGIFAGPAELVGLLDAVRDYPTPGVWFLGLLLLEPARRNQGLGGKVYRAFEAWARTLGGQSIRLSVAQQNEKAYQFWRHLGFEEMERRPPEMFGAKESVFILMSRILPPETAQPQKRDLTGQPDESAQHADRPAIAIAERLLAQAIGGPVRLGEGRDLGGGDRSRVYRFSVLDGPGDIPVSVIVKQVHSTAEAAYDPGSASIPAWTFFNEWASLQFLDQLAPGLAPRFYGGDRAAGVMVMEDASDGKRLDHFLLADDPIAAESALIEYASVHGRLHALTYGKQDDFYRIRDALGPRKMAGDYYDYAWLAPTLHTTMESLAVAPVPGIDAELAELAAAMLDPGPFLTFMRGDSCPDNCLYTDVGLRLIDFESGKFDHALKEGAYGLIHFPTCWCVYRLPEHIPQRMLATYRAELVRGCPAAADDALFYHAVVAACVFWLLDWYHDVPVSRLLEKDCTLAAASDRQRSLLRSDIVAQLTEKFRHLEAIGAAVRTIAAKMRASWPETETMPYYPAFR